MKMTSILGMNVVGGDVGLELEIEGRNLPAYNFEPWHVKGDGSLRNGYEYVTNGPVLHRNVRDHLNTLWDAFKANNSRIDLSHRTSTHVHVNVTDLNINHYFNLICTYLILEDILVHFCGDTREGNNFCLRAKDAEYLIDTLSKLAEQGEKVSFRDTYEDHLKYSAMNIACTRRFGSIEFRAMRGTEDIDTLVAWVDILMGIKSFAKQFKHPFDIITEFSMTEPIEFAKKVLGKHYDLVTSTLDQPIETLLFGGMRRSQQVAHSFPFSKTKEWNRKPFKSSLKYNQPYRGD